jgi:hypothetical protein
VTVAVGEAASGRQVVTMSSSSTCVVPSLMRTPPAARLLETPR